MVCQRPFPADVLREGHRGASLAGSPGQPDGGLHAGHIAVMIRAPHVDAFIETALELVGMIGNYGGK